MELIFSPSWFYNIDSAFEVVSVIVTAAIALYSLKIYHYTKEKRHMYFGLSFLSISLGYLAKVLTNVVVYHKVELAGQIVTSTQIIFQPIPLFTITGLFLHRILMLAGLAGIYLLLGQCRQWDRVVVIGYFIIITTLFSGYAYFVFHITAALFLMYIVGFYYQHCKAKKASCNPMVLAFTFLLLSQLAFIFIFLSPQLYVVGESLQLVGFIVLMYQYYKLVLKRE